MNRQTATPATPNFFDRTMAQAYDQRNSALAPISRNLHFLIQLMLEDLPPPARALCIGVGTGAEILSLAEAYPEWSFVGVDPSADMLEVCRDRLRAAGVENRCELIQGYVEAAPRGNPFDVALSILVAHFIQREGRPSFYRNICNRLKPGGHFVTAEISTDLDGPDFPDKLEDWKRIQRRMGATPDSLAGLEKGMRDTLGVLSPLETETLLQDARFAPAVAFLQAFMVRGWRTRKI